MFPNNSKLNNNSNSATMEHSWISSEMGKITQLTDSENQNHYKTVISKNKIIANY